MKEAYYFSHDANARNDPKILSMMTKYAWHGYGLYWAMIEIMREQDGYKLIFDKYTYEALAMQLHQDAEQMHDFVSDCIDEYKLFKCCDGFIYSDSLLRRMLIKDKISEKRSNAASARWNKNKEIDANALQDESKSNAIKGKEKKVKGKEINNIPQNEFAEHEEFYLTKKKRKLKGKRLSSFLRFWVIFDYKKDKANAADAWYDIPELTDAIVDEICEAAEIEKLNRSSKIKNGQTPIYAQGWLTSRRWEDETELINNPTNDKELEEMLKIAGS